MSVHWDLPATPLDPPPSELPRKVVIPIQHYDDNESDTNSCSKRKSSDLTAAPTRKYMKTQRSFSLVPERLYSSKLSSIKKRRRFSFNSYDEDGETNWNLLYLTTIVCEVAMKTMCIMLLVCTMPVSLFLVVHVIAQYQRAVLFRLGRLISPEPIGPGLVLVMPCIDQIKRIDLRTLTFDVPTQEVLTSDSVTVAVDAVVYYRIFDPVMSVVNVEDASRSTRLLAQTTLRNVLGTVDLAALLAGREEIATGMQEALDAATDTWGMKVERVEIKDVRLPVQLQRAMAAEAEAAREARAKIIAAEGEQRSARSLREAAQELCLCAPTALQLRYLQTLNSISAEKNSTIIFPVPLEMMQSSMTNNTEKKMNNQHCQRCHEQEIIRQRKATMNTTSVQLSNNPLTTHCNSHHTKPVNSPTNSVQITGNGKRKLIRISSNNVTTKTSPVISNSNISMAHYNNCHKEQNNKNIELCDNFSLSENDYLV